MNQLKYLIVHIKQLVDMLPVELRKPRLISLLIALLWPLISLWEFFRDFITYIIEEIGKNGQVIVLEKLLNDAFDTILRRIYITDATQAESTGVFLVAEQQVDPDVYLVTEIPPGVGMQLFTTQEIMVGDDFIVWIPIGLLFDFSLLNALLQKYKIAGVKYRIQYY